MFYDILEGRAAAPILGNAGLDKWFSTFIDSPTDKTAIKFSTEPIVCLTLNNTNNNLNI
jgi:hypothetical protein